MTFEFLNLSCVVHFCQLLLASLRFLCGLIQSAPGMIPLIQFIATLLTFLTIIKKRKMRWNSLTLMHYLLFLLFKFFTWLDNLWTSLFHPQQLAIALPIWIKSEWNIRTLLVTYVCIALVYRHLVMVVYLVNNWLPIIGHQYETATTIAMTR